MEAQPSATQWDEFHQKMSQAVNPVAWQTWLQPLMPNIDSGTLVLEAPSSFHLRWVRDHYLPAIEDVVVELFGDSCNVELIARAPVANEAEEPAPRQAPSHLPPQPQRMPQQQTLRPDSRLVPKYTFDNFVVGQSNRFAHAAAMAVSERPGGHYNPLFIYGPAGLGKTHLLHAVGHHTVELQPDAVVRYISSEQFFNEFINGIRRKRMDEFKARYRTIDVLLLDDVQFFEGKEQILEEFFHTFNSLYEAGKQLVISSDRHPKHLSTLEDRLRSRFEWGLQTDIQPPDVETRLAILRKNAEFAPMLVPREVLDFIALHVLDNIRELEGALTRVTAFAALTHEQIGLEMAERVLKDLMPAQESRALTAQEVIATTASYFVIPPLELTGPSRKQPLAQRRQISMYLCRELTDLSLPKIGQAFNGRDHTTVMHAIEKVKSLIQSDKAVFDDVNTLSQMLRSL